VIRDEHGEDLLACFLAGHDHSRNSFQLYSDDFWAQWMWRFSGIELVGKDGDSKGPADFMREASPKGPR